MPRARKNTLTPPNPQIAEFLYPLVNNYRGRHREYRQNDAAKAMRFSATGLSNILNGLVKPSLEECLIIARYYGFPVEDLLAVVGYPTVRDLLAFAQTLSPKTDDGALDKDLMVRYLRMALEPEWKSVDSSDPFKANAEIFLTRSDISLYVKAHGYAEMVAFWEVERPHAQRRIVRSGEFATLTGRTS